jgi:hypothetical protein
MDMDLIEAMEGSEVHANRRSTMHDLDNPAAPANGVQANITGQLFKRWMKSCGAIRIDEGNAYQIVAILVESAKETVGNVEFTPNWHLTMMGNRDSTVSVNFHFKIEIGKPFSHYWHYVLHRVAATQTWYWVGDASPHIPTTNQGGGGAGNDIQALRANYSLVQMASRSNNRTAIENGMSKKKQNKLVAKLTKWDQAGIIQAGPGGTWDGGTST